MNPDYGGMRASVDTTGLRKAFGPLRIVDNTLRLICRLERPRRVVPNFDHDRDWNCNVGVVVNAWNRLAVGVSAAAKGQVVLRFRNPIFEIGLGIDAAAVVDWFALFVWLHRAPSSTPVPSC